MKLSPVRILLVLLFVFIGCFGVAYAAAGMLTALPAPAIGGTCGPSTGSETALEALAKPSSIGAGPEPATSNTTGHHQWETFVQQCQTLADRRGLASLAVLVVSLAVAVIGLIWVLRKPRNNNKDGTSEPDDLAGTPAYTPLGLHDQAALVGAGAVVGTPAAPVAAWPSTQPPVYGAPPAYPPPQWPGSPTEGGYPPQAWPTQPPGAGPAPAGYPERPQEHSPQSYPPVAPLYPTATPPPAAYPAPAYPAPGYPAPGYPAPADARQTPSEHRWTTPAAPTYQAPPYGAPPASPYGAPPAPYQATPDQAPPTQAPPAHGPIEAAAAPPPPPPPPLPPGSAQIAAPDHEELGSGDSGAPSEDPSGLPGGDSAPPA